MNLDLEFVNAYEGMSVFSPDEIGSSDRVQVAVWVTRGPTNYYTLTFEQVIELWSELGRWINGDEQN